MSRHRNTQRIDTRRLSALRRTTAPDWSRGDVTAEMRRQVLLAMLTLLGLASSVIAVLEATAAEPETFRLFLLAGLSGLFVVLGVWLWRRPASLPWVQVLLFGSVMCAAAVGHVLILHFFGQAQLIDNLFNVLPWLPIAYVLSFVMFRPRRALQVSGVLLAVFLTSTVIFMLGPRADLLTRRIRLALWVHSTVAPMAYIIVLLFIARFKAAHRGDQVRLESLRGMATTDELTGLPNRRAVELHFGALSVAVDTLSVVMFDIDRFKAVNDTHGHDIEDMVLREVALRAELEVRPADVVGLCVGKLLQCNDSNPCTKDGCDPKKGTCHSVPLPLGTTCSDANPCTTGETCTKAGCSGIAWPKSDHCNDKNACTTDSCDPKLGCRNLANSLPCDDGNACTGPDRCLNGTCQGKPALCDDKNPCTHDVCDPKQPKPCVHLAFSGCCDDGNACTVGEVCVGGACKLGSKRVCDDHNPCTADACDPKTGCTAKAVPGASCVTCTTTADCASSDNGDPCDGTLACLPGPGGARICSPDPSTIIACDGIGDGICTVGCCAPKTGKCVIKKRPEGMGCDDGSVCTPDTHCDAAGFCVGEPILCDDNNGCTIDSCDPATGCLHALMPKNSACDHGLKVSGPGYCADIASKQCMVAKPHVDCTKDADCGMTDDGDRCNGVSYCHWGVCNAKPNSIVKCPDSGDPCAPNVCMKNTGQCVAIKTPDGGACDDGNACTRQDRCLKGKCEGKKLVMAADCDDCNPCTTPACDKKKGCVAIPKKKGVACDDGNSCTSKTVCSGPGARCEGTIKNCNDGNACTLDRCVLGKGCVHKVQVNAACSDGSVCTTGDACTAKGSCSGKPVDCKKLPDAVCHKALSCDAKKGCIFAKPVDCDDGNACTKDTCQSGKGCVNTKLSCDDGKPCTVDACDKLKGCIHANQKDGYKCDDGSVCTEKETCKSGVCVYKLMLCPPCHSAHQCLKFDDGDPCNGTYVCAKPAGQKFKICLHKKPVPCDTSKDTPCRRNWCQQKSGTCAMLTRPDGFACDDGDPCTVVGACKGGKCTLQGPVDCSPLDAACIRGSCVPKKGQPGYSCVKKPVADAAKAVCDADGKPCTGPDRCVKGKCVGGPKRDCSKLAGPCVLTACKPLGTTAFTCTAMPRKNGSACQHGSKTCLVGGTCKSGACFGAEPRSCDDKKACTLDACRMKDGTCLNQPIPGCK